MKKYKQIVYYAATILFLFKMYIMATNNLFVRYFIIFVILGLAVCQCYSFAKNRKLSNKTKW